MDKCTFDLNDAQDSESRQSRGKSNFTAQKQKMKKEYDHEQVLLGEFVCPKTTNKSAIFDYFKNIFQFYLFPKRHFLRNAKREAILGLRRIRRIHSGSERVPCATPNAAKHGHASGRNSAKATTNCAMLFPLRRGVPEPPRR